MRTIGMLLGIPEEDQEAIRERIDEGFKHRSRRRRCPTGDDATWSVHSATTSSSTSSGAPKHPSDDLMTELLTAEFEDETGTTRKLTRDEVAQLRRAARRGRATRPRRG